MHLQEAACPLSVHSAFVPHGDGLQGWMTSIGLGVATKNMTIVYVFSRKETYLMVYSIVKKDHL